MKIRYRGNEIERGKKSYNKECFNSWSLRLRAQNCACSCLYEQNAAFMLLFFVVIH